MAHFAELNDDNIVVRVIVVDNAQLRNPVTGKEEEVRGKIFCEDLLGGRWVQTSYNSNFRNCYAGIGYKYYEEFDIFMPPSPYPSWNLNLEKGIWESPVPEPVLSMEGYNSGIRYVWNEDLGQWEMVNVLSQFQEEGSSQGTEE